jgi:hypothetical protein
MPSGVRIVPVRAYLSPRVPASHGSVLGGPGDSAAKRANALRNIIEAGGDLPGGGRYAEAKVRRQASAPSTAGRRDAGGLGQTPRGCWAKRGDRGAEKAPVDGGRPTDCRQDASPRPIPAEHGCRSRQVQSARRARDRECPGLPASGRPRSRAAAARHRDLASAQVGRRA